MKFIRLLMCMVIVLAAVAMLASGVYLVSYFRNESREEQRFEELYREVETAAASEAEEAEAAALHRRVLARYESLYEKNEDLCGFLRIPGTTIHYPVMYTPEEPQYYLHRDFRKEKAAGGTPFLDAECFEGCGNYLIYGHHMKNGSMFGKLMSYEKASFWAEHPFVEFDTLYERVTYRILAAFFTSVAEEEGAFRFDLYTNLREEKRFEEYLEAVQARSLYETDVTAAFGQELLTLATCSYHTENGRFVVVAVRE